MSAPVCAIPPGLTLIVNSASWWFGVWMLIVRLLQTSVLTCFGNPNVQASFAAFIALISIVILREMQPFLIRSDGALLQITRKRPWPEFRLPRVRSQARSPSLQVG